MRRVCPGCDGYGEDVSMGETCEECDGVGSIAEPDAMTAQDYVDAIERHYLGGRFVSALVLSPRLGVYVGVVRVLGGEVLHRTGEHATSAAAALALARLCGATKHEGDAGVNVDLRQTGCSWTLHYRTGMTPGGSPLGAVAHALRIARWHADNERVLQEREGTRS